jgi:hypothetical protein
VDWGTLAATALGAILGAGSTLTVDRSRWRRDHHSREHVARRELYGQYLASLALATHQLRDLRRPGPLTADDRMRRAGEVLRDSGAYQLRYQMLITAPDVLEAPTEHAFASIRRLRDRFDEPDVCTDPQWDIALGAVSDAILALKRAMRDGLAASP